MLFLELYEIMVNKIIFVGFRGVNSPIFPLGSAPGPQTVDSQYSGGLFSEWLIYELTIEDFNILS